MWVEIDVDGATERATVRESRNNVMLASYNSARGMGVLHECRMAQKGVQLCKM